MNPFSLFENNNLEEIKLGLKVIKSLDLEREFEEYFEITYSKYKGVFNKIVIPLVNTKMNWVITEIIKLNLKIDKLDTSDIFKIIIFIPEAYKYFNLYNLNSDCIYWILLDKPDLIKYLPHRKLDNLKVVNLLKKHPYLIKYFNCSKLKIS